MSWFSRRQRNKIHRTLAPTISGHIWHNRTVGALGRGGLILLLQRIGGSTALHRSCQAVQLILQRWRSRVIRLTAHTANGLGVQHHRVLQRGKPIGDGTRASGNRIQSRSTHFHAIGGGAHLGVGGAHQHLGAFHVVHMVLEQFRIPFMQLVVLLRG